MDTTVMDTTVIKADWHTNTSPVVSFSEQCCSASLAISIAFFDVSLSTLGLSLTIRHLWLMLHAETTDIFRMNLSVFHLLNDLGLVVDLFLSVVQPEYLLTSRAALLGLILMCGPLILCCICIERYVAVVHPTRYLHFRAKRYRELSCVAVWFITFSFPYGWQRYICLSFKFVACVFLLCLLTMIWCNSRILLALKETGPGRDTLHPMKVKAFTTVRLISLLILVFYVPAAIILTVLATCKRFEDNECILVPLCIILCSFASIVHPLFRLFVQQHLK